MKTIIKLFVFTLLVTLLTACGHSHDWQEIEKVDATCTEDGKVTYVCSGCDETKEEVIKAGHDWQDATCTLAKTCLRCGETEGEALGHTVQSGKCDRCNENVALGLGSTFEFDHMLITLDDKYTLTTVKNKYCDYYKKTVVKIGVTVKNNKDENSNLNMFYYKHFGSKGTELNDITAYFDDEVGWAGELRPGASYKKYFYALYDGDGTYAIVFDDWFNKLTVEYEVKK